MHENDDKFSVFATLEECTKFISYSKTLHCTNEIANVPGERRWRSVRRCRENLEFIFMILRKIAENKNNRQLKSICIDFILTFHLKTKWTEHLSIS